MLSEIIVSLKNFSKKFEKNQNNSKILNRKIDSFNIHQQIQAQKLPEKNSVETFYKTYSQNNDKDLHPRIQLKNNLLISLKRLSYEFKNQPFQCKGLDLENHIVDYIYHYLTERVIELHFFNKLNNPIEIIQHIQIIIKEALDKQVLDYNTEMEYDFNTASFLRFCQTSLQEKKHSDLISINSSSLSSSFGHPLAFGVAKVNIWE